MGGAGTGSLYEDVWVLPAPTAPTGVAKAQNHEYIEGRYAEILFNDSSIQPSQVSLGAFQVKARYSTTDVATISTSHAGLVRPNDVSRATFLRKKMVIRQDRLGTDMRNIEQNDRFPPLSRTLSGR